MHSRIAALLLAAVALGGCSGHSEQARAVMLKALDLECLHTELLFADLANPRHVRPSDVSLDRSPATAGTSPQELRAMTGEVVEIFSNSPGRHEELARVARELFIATGEAQAAMRAGGALSNSSTATAAIAIQRMRELQAKLFQLADPRPLESLPKA
jgi:hypothetical protein